MTPNDLNAAIADASAGDAVVYFTGELSRACGPEEIALAESRKDNSPLPLTPTMNIREQARYLYRQGLVLLAQRRTAGNTEYLAVKCRKPSPTGFYDNLTSTPYRSDGLDRTTNEGAHESARRIREYWGKTPGVVCKTEKVTQRDWGVRSNLLNGRPAA